MPHDFFVQFADDVLPEVPRLLVVGLGSLGITMLDEIVEALGARVESVAVGCDGPRLRETKASERIVVPRRGGLELSGLQGWMAGADVALVCGGLTERLGPEPTAVTAAALGRLARRAGALAVALEVSPLALEGERQRAWGEEQRATLESAFDAVFVFPGELANVESELPVADALAAGPRAAGRAGVALLELGGDDALVNVELSDLHAVLRGGGRALLTTGEGQGREAALTAMRAAQGALAPQGPTLGDVQGLLVQVASSSALKLRELQAALEWLKAGLHPEVHLKLGVSLRPELDDRVRVTLVGAEGTGQSRGPVPRVRQLELGWDAPPPAEPLALPLASVAFDALLGRAANG